MRDCVRKAMPAGEPATDYHPGSVVYRERTLQEVIVGTMQRALAANGLELPERYLAALSGRISYPFHVRNQSVSNSGWLQVTPLQKEELIDRIAGVCEEAVHERGYHELKNAIIERCSVERNNGRLLYSARNMRNLYDVLCDITLQGHRPTTMQACDMGGTLPASIGYNPNKWLIVDERQLERIVRAIVS